MNTHTHIYICLVEFIPFLAHVSPCVIVLAYPADTEVSIDEVFDFRGWSKENVVDYYPYMCQYIISYIYINNFLLYSIILHCITLHFIIFYYINYIVLIILAIDYQILVMCTYS